MNDGSDAAPKTLLEALLAWANPALIDEVKRHERRRTTYSMKRYHRPALLPDAQHLDPEELRWSSGGDTRLLDAAWEALERDFSARIIRAEIYLQGVQVAPELETVHRPIPGVWASDCHFNFEDSTIGVQRCRYTAVRASRTPPAEVAVSRNGPAPSTITSENVRRLTDDEVFTLLEDYARRVVEEPYALLLPSRISFMPMIARKMRFRAEAGELRDTLADEARDLELWIAERAPSHQSPAADSIENAMRVEYRTLKAQSKGMKP